MDIRANKPTSQHSSWRLKSWPAIVLGSWSRWSLVFPAFLPLGLSSADSFMLSCSFKPALRGFLSSRCPWSAIVSLNSLSGNLHCNADEDREIRENVLMVTFQALDAWRFFGFAFVWFCLTPGPSFLESWELQHTSSVYIYRLFHLSSQSCDVDEQELISLFSRESSESWRNVFNVIQL